MRALFWHAISIGYEDLTASTRPSGIHPQAPELSSGEFRNCLACFITIEEGDTSEVLRDAADGVLEAARMVRPKGGVLLIPFAHLSRRLATPNAARSSLQLLAELVEPSVAVTLASFGFHKAIRFTMDVGAHPGSVMFRHYTKKEIVL